MRKTATLWMIGIAAALLMASLFALLRKPADPRAQALSRAKQAGLSLESSETRPPRQKTDDARPILEELFSLIEEDRFNPRIQGLILEASAKPNLTWDFKSGGPYPETADEEFKFLQMLRAAHSISDKHLLAGTNREALELLAAVDQIAWNLLQNPGKHAQTNGVNLVRSNVKGWAQALGYPLTEDELAFASREIEKSTEYRMSVRLFLAEELATYRKLVQTRVTGMVQGKQKASLKEVEILRDTEIVFAENLAKSLERLGDRDREYSVWREAFEPETTLLLDPKHPSFKYLEAFWPKPSLLTDVQVQGWVDSLLLSTAAKMLLESKQKGVELSKTLALANSRDPITGKPFQFKETPKGFALVSPESGLMPSGIPSHDIVLEVHSKD